MTAEVEAAGAVVWRVVDGVVEVLLVHRPRYDDWSYPKGKRDGAETLEAAARREVAEETGYHVELGRDLGELRYRDHKERPKVVRYWAASVSDGWFEANDEVDEIRWLPLDEAAAMLTYPRDRALLIGF